MKPKTKAKPRGNKINVSQKKALASKKRVKYVRKIHKKIALHPFVIFMWLVVGVLLIGSTLISSADNNTVSINATIPAKQITTPAHIVTPVNEQTTASSPVFVKGTCPDQTYVDLIRNGYFSGVAICVSGSFSIETDLTPGQNNIYAQVFNYLNQAGPESNNIMLNYTGPDAAVSGTTPTEASNSLDPSSSKLFNQGNGTLLLTAKYAYRTFPIGGQYNWEMDLDGGTGPYVINIAWGDDHTSDLFLKSGGNLDLRHKYSNVGNYNIVISAVDALGQRAVFQMAAVIKVPNTASSPQNTIGSGTIFGSHDNSGLFGSLGKDLWFIWPSYGIVILMTASFWLGERRELQQVLLHNRVKPIKRKP